MDGTPSVSRSGVLCFLGVLLGCLGAGAQPEPRQPQPPPRQPLQIVSRMPLLERQSVPTDIRWASDDSVYLSWDRDGVLEVGLDGARRREMVPNLKELGGLQHYSQLAVSPTSLLMGISKPVLPPGVRDGWLNAYSAQLRGAVAWVGTLSAQFQDFQPVLFDVGGPALPTTCIATLRT